MKFLLVEDHPINQKLAISLIERAGHQVTLADTGHPLEAQERLIDAVYLDVWAEVSQDADHPVTHVPIEGVV